MKKKTEGNMKPRRRRIIVFMFVSFMIIWALVMYSNSLVPTPPNIFAQTATALIGKVTKDAQSTIMTEEALGIKTATKTPLPTLDGSPDAFHLTSTELVDQVTQQAIYLTDVGNGDATAVPFQDMVDQWIVNVENQVGFSHPELDQVVRELLDKYQLESDRVNFPQVVAYTETYKTGLYRYTVVTISTSPSKFGGYRVRDEELLIFRRKDNFEEFLIRHSLGQGYFIANGGMYFFDINQNGLINLVIAYLSSGECPFGRVMILEFSDDSIKDISPPFSEQPNNFYSDFKLVDIDNDQIFEIKREIYSETIHETCEVSDEIVDFKWNGERYARVD